MHPRSILLLLLPLIACKDGGDDTAETGDFGCDDTLWYIDADGDGYGSDAYSVANCDQPEGYVDNAEDCNDLDGAVNPETLWFKDSDGDGYGDPDAGTPSCEPPADHVINDQDCDDDDPERSPETLWFEDNDGDGYGFVSGYLPSCERPDGHSLDPSDCDDSRAETYPGADEICDGLDNDCDGAADEDAIDAVIWYSDLDDDGYGDPANQVIACDQLLGTVPDDQDCDDAEPSVNPDALEICNDGIDNDCDGGLGPCVQVLDTADSVLYGSAADDAAGSSLSAAGDVDGDGAQDLWVGASLADGNGSNSGVVYLVNGPVASGAVDLASASARLLGDPDERAGLHMNGGVDLSGDGVPDVAVGVHRSVGDYSSGFPGAVHLVYGPVSGDVTLSSDSDLVFYGERRYDRLGQTVHLSADVSGDGQGDLLAGAAYSPTGLVATAPGTVYVLRGPLGTGSAGIETADLIINGQSAGDFMGGALSSVDTDGDGVEELLIGVSRDDSAGADAGAAYLVDGTLTGTVSLASADLEVFGETASDGFGTSVAPAGDVDGDGYDEFLVGAPGDDDNGSSAGAVYVLSGSTPDGSSASAAWAKLLGASTGDSASGGYSGGDIDGDGTGDVVVSATGAGNLGEGAAFLMLGPLTAGSFDLGGADARFEGADSGDGAGAPAAFVNDFAGAGDGFDDLLLGATAADIGGSDSGAVYLIGGLGI